MVKEKVILTSFLHIKYAKKANVTVWHSIVDQFQGALNMVRNIGHCRAYAIVLRTNRIVTSKEEMVINSA